MRLIDADELKIDFGFTWDDIAPTREEMFEIIDRQPSIDAHVIRTTLQEVQAERKMGKWIHNDSWVNTCSECGMGWNRAFLSDQWNFCPNCGADMRGEEE